MAFLESAGAAFLLILLAEFGDKTQLVLVTLALRGQRGRLLAGAAVAFALLTAVAVLAADLIARVLPPFWIGLIGGALFLVFGLLTLREGIVGEEAHEPSERPGRFARLARGPFTLAFLLVSAAELGDKTQIAVAVLAAETGDPIAVGLGGWLALVLLSALALLVGAFLAERLPGRAIRIAAGIIFLVVGILLLVAGVREAGASLGTLLWG